MAAIEDGLYQPNMKARMAELEREQAEIAARLAEAPQDVPDVHPGIAEIYKRKVAKLTETLADPESRLDASSDIRSLDKARAALGAGDHLQAKNILSDALATSLNKKAPSNVSLIVAQESYNLSVRTGDQAAAESLATLIEELKAKAAGNDPSLFLRVLRDEGAIVSDTLATIEAISGIYRPYWSALIPRYWFWCF